MYLYAVKSLWRKRWHVYQVSTEERPNYLCFNKHVWIATFAKEADAVAFVGLMP